ncbi:histidine phosphatase family protein [Aliishimia ponticola]|uniref:Histidine phosphatase family protein n=1 Tax=Aliishimia ponticola TaxID=2499833 RepID=A0A4S4NIY7_9RHOB|nr:histidine phosphatase family protein [Aliishimia ponticola]THH38181.1 histidine phosphatase family protein [Aliishimia ponticola]
MTPIARDELILLRHAPADHGGRLCGRTDVAACLPGEEVLAPLRARLAGAQVVTSPALRCQATAQALFPDRTIPQDPRLWEQDFGTDDGRAFCDLPDLGPLTTEELARHAAPEGESFLDMTARIDPALMAYAASVQAEGPMVLVAHAGTARAALGIAMGHPALALKFEIAPLSLVRLRCFAQGFSVIAVNEGGVT